MPDVLIGRAIELKNQNIAYVMLVHYTDTIKSVLKLDANASDEEEYAYSSLEESTSQCDNLMHMCLSVVEPDIDCKIVKCDSDDYYTSVLVSKDNETLMGVRLYEIDLNEVEIQ